MKSQEVLILTRKPEIHSSRRLVQVLQRRNVSFRIEDPETPFLDEPSVVYPRLGSWRFSETMAHLLPLSEKFRFINTPSAYQKSRNKWHALQMLSKRQIPTPLTQMISREEFLFLSLPFPFVLKDLYGIQGMGVYLIHTQEQLNEALARHPETQLFLVQKYIEEAHGEDLRIFITRSGNSWSMKRKNSQGDFRSNLHVGGQAFSVEASNEELDMAFLTLEIFQLDYAGVDILRSTDGPLMIEVNPCPGFEGLESLHGPVIAEALLDLLKN
jgi:ribosomal protein S6--L-glutamate ligase